MNGSLRARKLMVMAVTTGLLAAACVRADSASDRRRKAKRLTIPVLDVENGPAGEVLRLLQKLSRQLESEGTGINLLLVLDPERTRAGTRPRVTLRVADIPVLDAIRYVCTVAGLSFRVDKQAVIVADPTIPLDEMETRFYPVAPGGARRRSPLSSPTPSDPA